jgi:hypothetical protein
MRCSDDQVAAGRRSAALTRLRRYAGLESGYTPLTVLAERRICEKLGMSFDDVLLRSTINPAKIIGRVERLGTLQVDSPADVARDMNARPQWQYRRVGGYRSPT